MDVERLAGALLAELAALCPDELSARYKLAQSGMSGEELLVAVSRSRSFLLSGGEADTERAARIVLDEYRAGKIARVTLDSVSEEKENGAAE